MFTSLRLKDTFRTGPTSQSDTTAQPPERKDSEMARSSWPLVNPSRWPARNTVLQRAVGSSKIAFARLALLAISPLHTIVGRLHSKLSRAAHRASINTHSSLRCQHSPGGLKSNHIEAGRDSHPEMNEEELATYLQKERERFRRWRETYGVETFRPHFLKFTIRIVNQPDRHGCNHAYPVG